MRACRVLALFTSAALSITADLALSSTGVATALPDVRTGDDKTNMDFAELSVPQVSEDRTLPVITAFEDTQNLEFMLMSKLGPNGDELIKSTLKHFYLWKGDSSPGAAQHALFLQRLRDRQQEKAADEINKLVARSPSSEGEATLSLFYVLTLSDINPYQFGNVLLEHFKHEERKSIIHYVNAYMEFREKNQLFEQWVKSVQSEGTGRT